jgi:hypothetical protein
MSNSLILFYIMDSEWMPLVTLTVEEGKLRSTLAKFYKDIKDLSDHSKQQNELIAARQQATLQQLDNLAEGIREGEAARQSLTMKLQIS